MIIESHGWGGSKQTSITAEIGQYLDAGFGVLSFSQRGFGNSGGEANVQDPDLEAEDVDTLVDFIAALPWVAHNLDADGNPILTDPLLGAIGLSYGGGFQTISALDETEEEGYTRFDALSPEISWYDLPRSLAPEKVVRTAWNLVLYGAGAKDIAQYVHTAFAWGVASGQWPDGTLYGIPNENVPNLDAEFHQHSPVAFVERGVQLDIPVLMRQGQSDNLFNLNQGLDIFQKALTPEARAQSYFVGFNGGHALPNVAPLGTPIAANVGTGADFCTGNAGAWAATRIAFFQKVFAGEDTAGIYPARYNLSDIGGAKCLRANALGGGTTIAVNDGVDPTGSNGMVSTAGAGAPINLPIAEGPITVAGVPTLSGDAYSSGIDSRVFFGLSMGTTPADAQVIANNLMPLRNILPGTPLDDAGFSIELPGIAAEIPAGQSLFLTITPVSDMFFGHGSRAPAAFVFTDLSLHLPTTLQ
jgi:pimeloyl-ACP methyl ester carboxylesterase